MRVIIITDIFGMTAAANALERDILETIYQQTLSQQSVAKSKTNDDPLEVRSAYSEL